MRLCAAPVPAGKRFFLSLSSDRLYPFPFFGGQESRRIFHALHYRADAGGMVFDHGRHFMHAPGNRE